MAIRKVQGVLMLSRLLTLGPLLVLLPAWSGCVKSNGASLKAKTGTAKVPSQTPLKEPEIELPETQLEGKAIKDLNLEWPAEKGVEQEVKVLGAKYPVDTTVSANGSARTVVSTGDDEKLEEETYQFGSSGIQVLAISDESFTPPISLVQLTAKVGDKGTWKGKYRFAGKELPAAATVTTGGQFIEADGKGIDCIQVKVALTATPAGQKELKRSFTFWIEPKLGVVKRQTQAGTTRQPITVEVEERTSMKESAEEKKGEAEGN